MSEDNKVETEEIDIFPKREEFDMSTDSSTINLENFQTLLYREVYNIHY